MALTPLRAFLFVALGFMLVACAGSGGTATPPDPESLRSQTVHLLGNLSSVAFTVTHPNVPTDMGGGLLLETVEGTASFPDRAEMSATGSVQRVKVEFGIVQIGAMTYFSGPFGDTWRIVDPSTLPFNFVGMNTSVADALSSATEITTASGEKIEGHATFTLTGKILSDDLRGLVPGAASGAPLGLTVWVRKSDGMPVRVVLEGGIIDTDGEGMVRQLDLSRFDEPVTIEPPI